MSAHASGGRGGLLRGLRRATDTAETVAVPQGGLDRYGVPEGHWRVPVRVHPEEPTPVFEETYRQRYGHPLPLRTPQPVGEEDVA